MSADDLLRAIWDDPSDDEARHVYADHLERDGEPASVARADFIRVQCALAALPTGDGSPEAVLHREALQRRERDLWNRHRKAFRKGLPDRLKSCAFERGFVAPEFPGVTGHAFAKHYRELLPVAPAWNLGLRAIEPAPLEEMFASEGFARVRRLTMRAPGLLESLARSPHAHNLVELAWQYTFAPASVIQLLGALPRLAHLRIAACRLDLDAGLVASAGFAPRLRTLDLASAKLDAAGVGDLFGGGRFASLEELDLSYNTPGDAIVETIVTAARLPALARLRLFGMGLTPDAAEAMASWRGASALRELDLRGNILVGVAGVHAIVNSPHLSGLRSFSMFPSNVDHHAIVTLLQSRFGRCETVGRYGVTGVRG